MINEQPAWKNVFINGFAPHISSKGLEALAQALRENAYDLIQGVTTQPPPLECVRDWPCEAACAISYCGWYGEDLETVAEVEEYFAKNCFNADQAMGEPAACRWFISYFDDTPREEMRKQLLPVIEQILKERYDKEYENLICMDD